MKYLKNSDHIKQWLKDILKERLKLFDLTTGQSTVTISLLSFSEGKELSDNSM
jgi:hypothetical protein